LHVHEKIMKSVCLILTQKKRYIIYRCMNLLLLQHSRRKTTYSTLWLYPTKNFVRTYNTMDWANKPRRLHYYAPSRNQSCLNWPIAWDPCNPCPLSWYHATTFLSHDNLNLPAHNSAHSAQGLIQGPTYFWKKINLYKTYSQPHTSTYYQIVLFSILSFISP
jgi:hypothetical protein